MSAMGFAREAGRVKTIGEHAYPEDARRAAVTDARRRMSEGVSQNAATRAVASPLGVHPRTISRWADAFGTPLPHGSERNSAKAANAVRAHLVMSMQRQRDRAQDLLRIIDVQVEALTKQARKGAEHIDAPLVSRTVNDLATLQRLDLALMLQVGRQRASETSEEAERRSQARAEATVDEYAQQFERDLARFTGEVPPRPA